MHAVILGVYKLDNSRYEGSFRNGEFHGGICDILK